MKISGAILLLFVAVLLSSTQGSANAQVLLEYEELPRFYEVNGNLYRGAQPRPGGFERLAELGVRTVVNLRADDWRAQAAADEAHQAGLSYFNVPISRLGRPNDEGINHLLSLLTAPENHPVFVHCKYGVDRTGVVIAAYRIAFEYWTGYEALTEANRHGMKVWQFRKRSYIREFYFARLAELSSESNSFATDNQNLTRPEPEEEKPGKLRYDIQD